MAKKKKENSLAEFGKTIVIAVSIAVIFRSLLFEPFYIPSGSMKPTLLLGDYVFVTKYKYGYSRYSFPFGVMPITNRIFKSAPERGDVVVFKLPSDPSINYIKRLIGMPGDKIQVIAGVVYINGQAISKRLIGKFADETDQEVTYIAEYIETLPNGVSYKVLDETPQGGLDTTPVYEVPAGHYFMMGDNRDNSQDSRVLSQVGYIPEENLVGPAQRIVFSTTAKWYKPWDWFTKIRYERLFSSIPVK